MNTDVLAVQLLLSHPHTSCLYLPIYCDASQVFSHIPAVQLVLHGAIYPERLESVKLIYRLLKGYIGMADQVQKRPKDTNNVEVDPFFGVACNWCTTRNEHSLSSPAETPCNDHLSNDHLTNDHLSNEHVSNEHVSNEHVSHEHVSNEHVSDSHLSNDQIEEQEPASPFTSFTEFLEMKCIPPTRYWNLNAVDRFGTYLAHV